MKKILITLFVSISVGIVTISMYIFTPDLFETFDNKLRDSFFKVRGEKVASEDVVIVDIDEKSLGELGQWPWSRNKVAQILENMTLAEVGVIGFDIVFAESDNSSPKKIASLLNIDASELDDYDDILADMIANTPTIVGYIFEVDEQVENPEDIFLSVPAIFIEKNAQSNYLINPSRAILNIDKLQDSAYSTGFFNALPDEDGIVRTVPLVMKYADEIYPSLSFEMYRIFTGVDKVTINYGEYGIDSMIVGESSVPIDRHGRLFVNYSGPERSYKYISASDIYNNTFNKEDIAGKFVLIGTSAPGLLDLRATPFDGVYPGVEVHANIIDNLLTENYIYRSNDSEAMNMFAIIATTVLLGLILAFTGPLLTFIVSAGSLFLVLYVPYYFFVEQGLILNAVFPLVGAVSVIFLANAISYFLESKQKELIKGKFASKVSPEVMEDLIKQGATGDVLEGKEREVTVFFSDVRGFTNISEAMPSAKHLIEFLNEYMDPMVDIITKEKGTIDKFIGDAIMAYWNAPNDVDNHPDRAVAASINQIKALVPLNKKLTAEGKPLIDIGIGLNTGVATVGEMGSSGRSDYTVIGDPINLGARLESLCKSYGAKIIISQYTKALLKQDYVIRTLDLVRVKGKTEPVEIFEVLDFGLLKDAKSNVRDEITEYHNALSFYRGADFKNALEIFEKMNQKEDKLNKNIYNIYIERCKHYIEEPPADFDGVFTHTTKG